jgi:splicing factor 3B subunit 3
MLLYLQTGQLNEYTERKEMPSEAVCMALANVPVGEQRSRFLAVGLADNTVRIISLDPSVSLSLLLNAGSGVAAFSCLQSICVQKVDNIWCDWLHTKNKI